MQSHLLQHLCFSPLNFIWCWILCLQWLPFTILYILYMMASNKILTLRFCFSYERKLFEKFIKLLARIRKFNFKILSLYLSSFNFLLFFFPLLLPLPPILPPSTPLRLSQQRTKVHVRSLDGGLLSWCGGWALPGIGAEMIQIVLFGRSFYS